MESTRTHGSFSITTGHLDDLDRLAPLGTFYGLADHCCIGKSGALAVSSEATGVKENIPLPVNRIDESITACRIVPFHAPLETQNFRVIENFMS